jgi:hypothetical protein
MGAIYFATNAQTSFNQIYYSNPNSGIINGQIGVSEIIDFGNNGSNYVTSIYNTITMTSIENGRLGNSWQLPVTASDHSSAFFADMNGDGKIDLVSANGSQISLLLNIDGPSFQEPMNIGTIDNDIYGLCKGDYNNDNQMDFIAQGPNNDIFIFLNQGESTFVRQNVTTSQNRYSSECEAFDMNNDGLLDFIVPNFDGFTLYTNLGGGAFSESTLIDPMYDYDVNVIDIEIVDMNNDGLVDITATGSTGIWSGGTWPDGYVVWQGWTSVFFNQGDGLFTETVVIPLNDLISQTGGGQNGGFYFENVRLAPGFQVEDLNDDGIKEIIGGTLYGFNTSYYEWNGESYTEKVLMSSPNEMNTPAGSAFYKDINANGDREFFTSIPGIPGALYNSFEVHFIQDVMSIGQQIVLGGKGTDQISLSLMLSDASNGTLSAVQSENIYVSTTENYEVILEGSLSAINQYLQQNLISYVPAFDGGQYIAIRMNGGANYAEKWWNIVADVTEPTNNAPVIDYVGNVYASIADNEYYTWTNIWDAETSNNELVATFSSADEGVVLAENISWNGWDVMISQFEGLGYAEVTMTVTDPQGASSSRIFEVYVSDYYPEVCCLNSIELSCNQTEMEPQYLWYYDRETPREELIIAFESYNQEVLPTDALIATITEWGDIMITVNPELVGFGGTEFAIMVTDTLGQTSYNYAYFENIEDANAPIIEINTDLIQVVLGEEECEAIVSWETETVEQTNEAFGNNSSYITDFHNGMFFAAVNAEDVTSFGVDGNIGADGQGYMEWTSQEIISGNGNAYLAYVQVRNETSYDPGIHKIYLVDPTQTEIWVEATTNNNDDQFILNNLQGNTSIMYAMFGARDGGSFGFDLESMIYFATELATNVADAGRVSDEAGYTFDLAALNSAMDMYAETFASVVGENYYYIDIDDQTDGMDQVIGISDGGYDMYDGGNYLVSNFNNYYDNDGWDWDNGDPVGIPYTFGEIFYGPVTEVVVVEGLAVLIYDEECEFEFSSTHESGSAFPVGTTVVTYTAVDASGNESQASFTVEVIDEVAPTALAQDITVTLDINGQAEITAEDVNNESFDNCQIASMSLNQTTFTCADLGEVIVVLTITDTYGNQASTTAVVNVVTETTWYADADEDGFGTGESMVACERPMGYALASELISTEGDCDDNNMFVNPNAAEECGNDIDDDCDGQIDEDCAFPPSNDGRDAAVLVSPSKFPGCQSIEGTLADATSDFSEVVGDVWYKFYASTNGFRLAVNAQSDVMIELQNESGETITTKDVSAGNQEILFTGSLTADELYYVAIREVSETEGGAFAACFSYLGATELLNGPAFDGLCARLEIADMGAYNYTAMLTGIPGEFTMTRNGTFLPFYFFEALEYNNTYDLFLTTTYQMEDAAGNVEMIQVFTNEVYSVELSGYEDLDVRESDVCPAQKMPNTFIAATSMPCGVTQLHWEFTEVDAEGNAIGEPMLVASGAPTRYIRLSRIPGVHSGARYLVRIRPVFERIAGEWGDDYQMVCIANFGEGMAETEQSFGQQETADRGMSNEVRTVIYPNPNAGQFVQFALENVEAEVVVIRVLDAVGREVATQQWTASTGSWNGSIQFNETLSNGVYMIAFEFDGTRMTERLVVQH